MQQETPLNPNQVRITYKVNPLNPSEPDPKTYTFNNKEKWTFEPVYNKPFNGMNVFICTYTGEIIPSDMDALMNSMRSMGIKGGRRRTKRSSKRRRTNKRKSSKRRRTLRRRRH